MIYKEVLVSLVIIVIGLVVMKLLLNALRKILQKTKVEPLIHTFVVNMAKALLWVVLVIIILQVFGVPTAPIIAVLGAAGAAVALALKDSLANLAGGFMIIFNKPFKNGDYVEMVGIEGYVVEIDLFSTMVKTVDNKVILVPNGSVVAGPITNYYAQDKRRVDTVISVPYDSDLELVKTVLQNVAKECPYILEGEDVIIGVISHNSSSLGIDFKIWVKLEDYWPATYYIYENIKKAFDENGIKIPYDQLDVHLHQEAQ
ncbi:MAG: mechanosensitive ion channel [Clostridia bacterium]|nr:mechanosensitive ion channel [Clostridia bacterium]